MLIVFGVRFAADVVEVVIHIMVGAVFELYFFNAI